MHSIANSARGRLAAGAYVGVFLGLCLGVGPAAAEEGVPDRTVLGAADRLDVAGTVVRLEAEIWRAALAGQAAAQPGPAAATVVLRLTGDDGGVPAGVEVVGLWYVNRGVVSPAVALGDTMTAPDGEVMRGAGEVIDADGDGMVDVVVAVRDAAGARHLLKAPAQQVRAF